MTEVGYNAPVALLRFWCAYTANVGGGRMSIPAVQMEGTGTVRIFGAGTATIGAVSCEGGGSMPVEPLAPEQNVGGEAWITGLRGSARLVAIGGKADMTGTKGSAIV